MLYNERERWEMKDLNPDFLQLNRTVWGEKTFQSGMFS